MTKGRNPCYVAKQGDEAVPADMKNIISTTFVSMVKQRGIDKITVKALIDECNISRQTFYYHFRDIMEVIEWSMERAARAMLEHSLEADTPEEALGILISSTLNNRELILRLMDSQKREQIEALDFWAFGICGLLLQCCRKDHVDVENLAAQICRMIPGRT